LREELVASSVEGFRTIVTSGNVFVGFVGTSNVKNAVACGGPMDQLTHLLDYTRYVDSSPAIMVTEKVQEKEMKTVARIIVSISLSYLRAKFHALSLSP